MLVFHIASKLFPYFQQQPVQQVLRYGQKWSFLLKNHVVFIAVSFRALITFLLAELDKHENLSQSYAIHANNPHGNPRSMRLSILEAVEKDVGYSLSRSQSS